MNKWLIAFWTCVLFLSACQSRMTSYTILDGDRAFSLHASGHKPAQILSRLDLQLGGDDRVTYLGETFPLDKSLPDMGNIVLEIHRAEDITLNLPDKQIILTSSAQNVGQALGEAGYSVYEADFVNPPVETPISGPVTITYIPSNEIHISIDNMEITSRSAASTTGKALADAGMALIGLDNVSPSDDSILPMDGNLQVTRVTESVALTQKTIPYTTVNEPTADLEIDQQELLQGGESGLAIARIRIRNENGNETFRNAEGETVVRPPQDQIVGYGTKIIIRTAVVDGVTIEYWRALNLFATNYSPCDSAGEQGVCYYWTASRKRVQRGTIAFVQSWYFLFRLQSLYVPGYGYASVEDVGGGCPPAAAALGCPAGGHYWIDMGWSEEEYKTKPTGISFRWKTIYFLTPIPANPGYILP